MTPQPVDGWTVAFAAAERLRLAGHILILDGRNIDRVKAAGDALLAALLDAEPTGGFPTVEPDGGETQW